VLITPTLTVLFHREASLREVTQREVSPREAAPSVGPPLGPVRPSLAKELRLANPSQPKLLNQLVMTPNLPKPSLSKPSLPKQSSKENGQLTSGQLVTAGATAGAAAVN